MLKKSCAFLFAVLFAAGMAFAEDSADTDTKAAPEKDVVVSETTPAATEAEVAVEEDLDAVQSASVVKRQAESKSGDKKEIDKTDAAARRGAATKDSALSRANDASAARIGMLTAVAASKARGSATGMIPKPAAPVVVEEETDPNLECLDGEYPKGKKCEKCANKNNPAAIWANPGKDCKISKCGGTDYELIDADKDAPSCVKKCDVWGGVASREWDGERFGVCGSGKKIECGAGFRRTNEKTSASEIEFWHCSPIGTMTGECKNKGSINICEFPNGRGQQVCENGYWSTCTISKLCDPGFVEANPQEVYSVVKKQDQRMGVFDCVKK